MPFQPVGLQVTLSNNWSADSVPGGEAPELVFAGGGSGSMSLSLVLDTTDEGRTVTKYTDQLIDLMKLDPKLPGYDKKKKLGRPPWVRFHWGDIHSFTAVVESLDLTFTYFAANGTPLRARANLSLKQYEPDENWGRQTRPREHRSRTATPGATRRDARPDCCRPLRQVVVLARYCDRQRHS